MNRCATRLLQVFCTLLVSGFVFHSHAVDIPPASWATYLATAGRGVGPPRILAEPGGGFYLYSFGERPLIKFRADGSIAWEVTRNPGVTEVNEIVQLDILDDGSLLALVAADKNSYIFGTNVMTDGGCLARLRSADGTPVFVYSAYNCWLTAIKARPGGGFLVAGFGSGAADFGLGPINLGAEAVFLAHFVDGSLWNTLGRGAAPAASYMIQSIRTEGIGDTMQILAAGTAAAAPWTFGEKTLDQPGAYLVSMRGSGEVIRAESMAASSAFIGLETRPSGGAHLTWRNSSGQNIATRIDSSGEHVWEIPIAGDAFGIGDADELFVIGSDPGTSTWFLTAFDDAGAVKWRRSDVTRSASVGVDATILNDGRLAVSGAAAPAGIFIDDFFLGDLALIEATAFGGFVATFEVSSNAKPVFRSQPRDQKFVVRGEIVTLHAEVYSPGGCTLQWFKDGQPLPAETEGDLVLADAAASDKGTYFVEAQNPVGVTRSRGAEVIVNTISVTTLADGFNAPKSPLLLPDGAILVADSGNHLIRRVEPNGVTTFAGAGSAGLKGGAPLEALFSSPNSLCIDLRFDGETRVFVADRGNGLLRRIRFSPQTSEALSVTESGTAFAEPAAIATADGVGFVVVGDAATHRLFKVRSGISEPFVTELEFGGIGGVGVDARGNVYVADDRKHNIRRLALDKSVLELAGADTPGFIDGLGGLAAFREPSGIAVDESGNLFITERGNHSIRKISPGGQTTTIAGLGVAGSANGGAAAASFNAPEGICIRNGALIVADTGNNSIREIRFEPAQDASPIDAMIHVEVAQSVRLSVSGRIGERYVIESSAAVGPAASWREEGTLTVGGAATELSLERPATTRFYRARRLDR